MSNQGDARESAYQAYAQAARNPAVPKATKDALWSTYLAKLNADTGAQQARKLH